jgi:hypothetical protein
MATKGTNSGPKCFEYEDVSDTPDLDNPDKNKKVSSSNVCSGYTEPSPSPQSVAIFGGGVQEKGDDLWSRMATRDAARAAAKPPVEPTPIPPAELFENTKARSFQPSENFIENTEARTFGTPGPTGVSSFELPDISGAFSSVKGGISSLVDSGKSLINDGLAALPGAGNFGIPSLAGKAEEMVGGLFSAGKDTIGKFTSLFSGDKSNALSSVKNKLMPSAQNDASKLNYNNDSDPSSLFVTLRSQINPNEVIRFNVMPVIAESREATYEEVGIVHHPGQILRYKSSSTRTWGLNTKLISRTPEEASKNLKILNTIRAWVMPYYGYGTAESFANKLGAPPDILLFSAYGAKMIPEHPVVLLSYNTSYPNDIDYINTDSSFGPVVPFPVILNIDLNLKEAWSPKEYSSFDLKAYKTGDLKLAFSGKINTAGSSAAKQQGVAGAPGTEDPEARAFNASKGGGYNPEGSIENTEARMFGSSGQKMDTSTPNVSNSDDVDNPEARAFKASSASSVIENTEARTFNTTPTSSGAITNIPPLARPESPYEIRGFDFAPKNSGVDPAILYE